MHRVLVVGTSGAGKTTVATHIAAKLGLPLHASDPFYWQLDWQPASQEWVDACLAGVLDQPRWVLDGNFELQWQQVWNQAECVVWLDYPLLIILWQVTTRNFGWALRRTTVWSGNRMSIKQAISGILHAVRSHAAKRRRYPKYIAQLHGVTVLRFGTRRETRAWLSTLSDVPQQGQTGAA